MSEWIPFLQSIVWPLTVLILLFIFRTRVGGIFEAIRSRVAQGDPFEAGTGGIKLGSTQRPPSELDNSPSVREQPSPQAQSDVKPSAIAVKPNAISSVFPHSLYLVHAVRRLRQLTGGGTQYYGLRIYLDGGSEEELDTVKKVVYHLHRTFPEPIQTRTNPDGNFELRTRAWGEFNVWAEVFFKGRDDPLVLERYLNF